MDISKLELFFAAANSDNFTQAAEKCNVAQTTMSKYIAQLEDELGVKLFYRTTRECSLTEAGHSFYNGAKELRKDYESIVRQLQKVNENELTVGVYGEFFDLSILSNFRGNHPEVDLKVVFDSKENLYDQLSRRKIHAVLIPDILVSSAPKNPSFRRIDIMSGEACLFCSQAAVDNLGSIENVISELPYITKARETEYHEYCRKILMQRFGVTFRNITVAESKARQQLLLELSQGFAIMLRPEADVNDKIYSISLEGVFNETLQLFYSVRHVPASLKMFIDYINSTTFYA